MISDTGQRANVHCGADVLFCGLYQNVKGEAICPVCGNMTSITIKDLQIASASPSSAILRYGVEDAARFSICCSQTFIFDKKSCLNDWLRSYGGKTGTVSTLSAFMDEAVSRRSV